jgi:Cupin superfamily protein
LEQIMERFASRLVGSKGVPAFNAEFRERNAVKFEAALTAQEARSLFDVRRLQDVIAGPGAPAANTDIYRIQNLMRLSDIIRGSGRSALEVTGELLKIGCTLRFRDIDQFDRKLAGFAREVAETYAAETQVNVYFTPPAQDGLPPHFDNQDSFIVQVAGAKEWLIYKEYTDQQVLPGPDVDWDANRFRPVGTATPLRLRAGDVLYIPRGVMHSARCTNEESMHLTVTLSPLTMLNVLEKELRRLAAQDVELRRRAAWSLTGSPEETEALRNELRRLAAGLAERIDPTAAIAEKRGLLQAKSAAGANVFDAAVAALKPR